MLRDPGGAHLSANQDSMEHLGRVRTKTVKRASKALIEKYYPKLTMDFQVNKRLCDDIAVIQSKRLRNKIAGYTTHLMKRIQKGPVRGISFKLQEEERERKDQYVPEVSALDLSRSNGVLNVDKQTSDMVKSLGLKLPLAVSDVSAVRDRRYRKRV
ncbi:ribosomal protein S17A [Hanseniaspora osmophila]